MPNRFPPLLPQSQIPPCTAPQTVAHPALPSLPWMEWGLAMAALLMMVPR